MIRAAARAAALALALAPAASGQERAAGDRVVAALSTNEISIDATFSGSEIFLFGAIERERLGLKAEDPLNVVVTVTGPDQRATVWRKERTLGIFANKDKIEIDHAPSFYAVASTGPLFDVLSHTDDLRYKVSLDVAVRVVGAADQVREPEAFRKALIRLRRAAGLYSELPGAVRTIEGTLFETRLRLPANLTEGDYQARVLLTRDRSVIDVFETSIEVRKVGLERLIYNMAQDEPLLYGLLSILVALIAGWGASEIFRLLRR